MIWLFLCQCSLHNLVQIITKNGLKFECSVFKRLLYIFPGSSTTCSKTGVTLNSKYCGNYLGSGGTTINQPICGKFMSYIITFLKSIPRPIGQCFNTFVISNNPLNQCCSKLFKVLTETIHL